jgi:hypothetical protein
MQLDQVLKKKQSMDIEEEEERLKKVRWIDLYMQKYHPNGVGVNNGQKKGPLMIDNRLMTAAQAFTDTMSAVLYKNKIVAFGGREDYKGKVNILELKHQQFKDRSSLDSEEDSKEKNNKHVW